MPLADQIPDKVARVKEAIRIQQQIRKLEQRLAALLGDEMKAKPDDYSLTETQLKKAARNLHAQAKKKIAEGRAKELRGNIEALL